jgi:hypothetical protein
MRAGSSDFAPPQRTRKRVGGEDLGVKAVRDLCLPPARLERLKTAARLVLTSCEAFDNHPPGFPGRAVWLAAKVPGA